MKRPIKFIFFDFIEVLRGQMVLKFTEQRKHVQKTERLLILTLLMSLLSESLCKF